MERSLGILMRKKRNPNKFRFLSCKANVKGDTFYVCFAYTSPNQCTNCVVRNVTTMAITVGIANDKNVHLALFVSLYMLTSVVPHGK